MIVKVAIFIENGMIMQNELKIRNFKYPYIVIHLDNLTTENVSVIKNGKELKFSAEEFWEILEQNSIIAKSICKCEE